MVSQEMVPEGDRLGTLEMGVAGHNGFRMGGSKFHQLVAQSMQQLVDGLNFFHDVQTEIQGDLVVPAPSGMQLLAQRADSAGKQGFNVHMDVFHFH